MRWRVAQVPVVLPDALFALLQAARRARADRRREAHARAAGVALQTRVFRQSAEVGRPSRTAVSEGDGAHVARSHPIDPARTALVLVDVWRSHPVAGWDMRAQVNIRERLVPLLACCRRAGLTIVHAHHGQGVHPEAAPAPGELQVEGPDGHERMAAELKRRGIHHLLYAGYASNVCVLNRPFGLLYTRRLGFDTILVRDASLALENGDSLAGEWAHAMACYMVELNWGCTTTVADVQAALA